MYAFIYISVLWLFAYFFLPGPAQVEAVVLYLEFPPIHGQFHCSSGRLSIAHTLSSESSRHFQRHQKRRHTEADTSQFVKINKYEQHTIYDLVTSFFGCRHSHQTICMYVCRKKQPSLHMLTFPFVVNNQSTGSFIALKKTESDKQHWKSMKPTFVIFLLRFEL